VNDKTKNRIVESIFGCNGLLHKEDDYEFDKTAMELTDKFTTDAAEFVPYFKNLIPRLKHYVFEPSKQNDWIPLNWTNNNCESLNNIIKVSTNWKLLKLPDLIEELHKIVLLQYADIRRAIHGQGNYEVIQLLKRMTVSHMVWGSKNEAEKVQLVKRFMSSRLSEKSKTEKEKTLSSTDGKLNIHKTAAIAKKPGQRKRTRTERTVDKESKVMKTK